MQNISHHSPSLQRIVKDTVEQTRNNLTVQVCACVCVCVCVCVWSPNEDYLDTQQLTLQFLES